jgi:tripartite-type tricarboxylate transporter receptor subunit TctC
MTGLQNKQPSLGCYILSHPLHLQRLPAMNDSVYSTRLTPCVKPMRLWAISFLWLALIAPAIAQTYPAKPIRVLAGFGTGGGSDAMVRLVSAQMSSVLGQAVNIDNKPSTGSLSAINEAKNAPADGYTLLAADNGALVFNLAMYKKLPYDPASFAPIGVMARTPLLLVTNPNAGFKHVRDMLDKAKTQQTKIAYASPTLGSPFHVAMEMLKNRAGVDIVRVPFGSDAAALKDVLAGLVELTVIDLPSALPHIRSGKLQVLATFANKRMSIAPDAPALNELGYKDIDTYLWQSLLVSAATAKEVQTRLSQAMQTAMAQNAVRKNLVDNGWEVLASDPGLMTAIIAADTRIWSKSIKDAGISIE